MNLEETTQLYASVLRQLLPVGGYDASPNTEALAVDVYAHAKLLAQADLDAKRLLKVLEELPPELLPEYEAEYDLPLKCTVNAGKTLEERIDLLKWVRSIRNVLNKAYLEQLLAIFGVVVLDVVKYKPMQCTAPCNAPVNTEQLRYKVLIVIPDDAMADLDCIIENYLPGYLRVDVFKLPLQFKSSKPYPEVLIENIKIETSISKAVIFDPINLETELLAISDVAITGARMIRGIEYRDINLETESLTVGDVAITGAKYLRKINYLENSSKAESISVNTIAITGAKYL